MSPVINSPSTDTAKLSGAEHIPSNTQQPVPSDVHNVTKTETADIEEKADEPLFYSCPSTQERVPQPKLFQASSPSGWYAKDPSHSHDELNLDLDLDEFLDMSAFADPKSSSPLKPRTGKLMGDFSSSSEGLADADKDSFAMTYVEARSPSNPIVHGPPTHKSTDATHILEPPLFDTPLWAGDITSASALPVAQDLSYTAPAEVLGTARIATTHEVPVQDLDLDDLEDWLMGGNVEIVD
jgi:hypothetical protein